MATREAHIRHGFAAVRPYLHGHLDLADFVREVFCAVELERIEAGPKKFHIESQIGDSVVVLETGDPPHPSAAPASIYVYVEDVDAAYNRALESAPRRSPRRRTSPIRSGGRSAGFVWQCLVDRDVQTIAVKMLNARRLLSKSFFAAMLDAPRNLGVSNHAEFVRWQHGHHATKTEP